MATIPTHADWLKATELGLLQTRSAELKKVDDAIRKFELERNGPSLKALLEAWNQWKRTKPDWRKSERNKSKILDRLDDAIKERLGPLGQHPVDPAAMAALAEARRTAVQRLFAGRSVEFKKARAMAEARNAYKDLLQGADAVTAGGASRAIDSVKPSVHVSSPVSMPKFGPLSRALDSMVGKFFDEMSADIVRHHIIESFGGDVLASMVPVLGVFRDAHKVIESWGMLGKKVYDEIDIKGHKAWVGAEGSDAKQAFVALERLLDEAVKHAGITAARTTTAFASKAALTLADGGAISGPAVTAADAVAKVTHQLWRLGAEYQQTKRANRLLRGGAIAPELLDFRLVQVYPLLGCYVLTCSSLSDILDMARLQFGASFWMDDVEWMKKTHIDPVREKARSFLDASIFHVPGLTPLVKSGKVDLALTAKRVIGV